ncbi:MAG: 16S rRNA (adenine(1518)-N(6)/adenine(1519)-N(6))-dimethyltransferase RsmA [Armatimonadetes bacterium]|nr:16S rRNA (adenine(1518)-N(6)/adenine(1519)-N(6))-dimethyltransferase RsmA [Armatimonadota bacterium]
MNFNLLSPSEVKRLLERYVLRPKKRLGQNFLIDRNVLRKIIEAAELDAGSVVLEIGPGLGTVTQEAASLAAQVVAVEADRDLIPVLSETVGRCENVEIVNADFLQLDLPSFLTSRFGEKKCIVVGNLPYYITSPLITKLIEAREHIERMVLMVQQEVAERLAAEPATEGYGSLTVFVQYYCQVRIVARVKRTVFYPAPEVDSSIVRLDIRESPAAAVQDEALFFNIVRSAFGQRRKTLLKSLSGSPTLGWNRETAGAVLARAGIDPVRRGETLSIDEFAAIARAAG